MWKFRNEDSSVLLLVVYRIDRDGMVANQKFVWFRLRKWRGLDRQWNFGGKEESSFILHTFTVLNDNESRGLLYKISAVARNNIYAQESVVGGSASSGHKCRFSMIIQR